MGRSLRVRLAAGQAAVLAAVVAGYAGLLYLEVRRHRLAELDGQLDAAAAGLEAALRLFPPHDLDPAQPPPPFFPKGDRPPKGKGPPDGLSPRDRMLAGLTLPAGAGGYFAVWRADGAVFKAMGGPVPPGRPAAGRRPTRGFAGADRVRLALGPQRTTVLVGRPAGPLGDELAAFAGLLAGTGAAAVLAGVAASWAVSRGIVRPLAAIAATAERIAGDDPAERIAVADLDRELVRLGRVLNAAFDRLAAAADRQARFAADASHELRTPLTVVRARAELALRRDRTPAEYQAALAGILTAATRMGGLVEQLSQVARADAAPPAAVPVRLDELARQAVELLAPLAAERGVAVACDLQPATAAGDPAGLAAVADNLVGNAVRYDRPGGTVTVRVSVEGGSAVLRVTDTGPGIPAEAQPHVFERFYRADDSRTRVTGGSGLGLAIVKAVVSAHGGAVRFDTSPGGTAFTVALPAVPVDGRQTGP
jgi:signal transduction histidine kinase